MALSWASDWQNGVLKLAFSMRTSVPEMADLSKEPEHIFKRYGPRSRTPGNFAANCLLARRLAERGVRFIQLYHRGSDQHDNLSGGIKSQCQDTASHPSPNPIKKSNRSLLT